MESDSDSDADTTVPTDDDFMSVEDDDRVYCHICEMWVNGDLDHEHVFLNTNEQCGLTCVFLDCEAQCIHARYHRGPCVCEDHGHTNQCACTCGCPGVEDDKYEFCDQCGQCIGYSCGCIGGYLVPSGPTGIYCHLCADSFELEGHINLTEAKFYDCDEFILEPPEDDPDHALANRGRPQFKEIKKAPALEK